MLENHEKPGFTFFAFLPPYFGISCSLVPGMRKISMRSIDWYQKFLISWLAARYTKIDENLRKSKKIYENLRKSTKIHKDLRKSTKIYENLRKSTKINENLRKSTRIYEHLRKSTKIYEHL